MKKLLLTTSIALGLFFSVKLSGQTAGTLTFTFMPVAKTPAYSGTKNALAVWIQNTTGTGTASFVKTKLRHAGAGGGTQDHLATYAVNSGGAASNCLAAACNVIDATTGATLPSYTAKTITWDGKKGAAATGTLQPDGIYKVTIEETWNHGTTGTTVQTYTFTKGPVADHQLPANNAYFTGVKLDWVPAIVSGINESNSVNPEILVYPNPTNGIFNVDYAKANKLQVLNTLGIIVYDEKLDVLATGTKSIDLTNFANGIYFINVSNDEGSSRHKVILDK